MKFASWSVFASVVGGIGFGLIAFRQRYRSALAEVDRQRLEGDAESERLRLRLATVTGNNANSQADDPAAAVTLVETPPPSSDDPGGATQSNSVAEAPVAESPGDADDLKEIKGIGPVIEKALNDIGISRLDQIATFTPADIDRVSEALGSLARRLERDDWVGGARRLLESRQR